MGMFQGGRIMQTVPSTRWNTNSTTRATESIIVTPLFVTTRRAFILLSTTRISSGRHTSCWIICLRICFQNITKDTLCFTKLIRPTWSYGPRVSVNFRLLTTKILKEILFAVIRSGVRAIIIRLSLSSWSVAKSNTVTMGRRLVAAQLVVAFATRFRLATLLMLKRKHLLATRICRRIAFMQNVTMKHKLNVGCNSLQRKWRWT